MGLVSGVISSISQVAVAAFGEFTPPQKNVGKPPKWLCLFRNVYVCLEMYMTVGQKSCIQILNLGYHNRHIYMMFHFRYVASRKEIPQNTS